MSRIDEIKKRRTFAIISHPDAGKTTLTEKFLLYGGAINQAGSVKGKATAKQYRNGAYHGAEKILSLPARRSARVRTPDERRVGNAFHRRTFGFYLQSCGRAGAD